MFPVTYKLAYAQLARPSCWGNWLIEPKANAVIANEDAAACNDHDNAHDDDGGDNDDEAGAAAAATDATFKWFMRVKRTHSEKSRIRFFLHGPPPSLLAHMYISVTRVSASVCVYISCVCAYDFSRMSTTDN